jgi:hypothetical protein
MTRALQAGSIYFLLIFGLGFVLGTLRVLVVAPRLGALAAVLAELPVILTAAWLVCARVTAGFRVPRSWQARLVMGGIAFALLMLAELGLSVVLLGNSLVDYLAAYRAVDGALGLAGQVAFAVFPLAQARGPARSV